MQRFLVVTDTPGIKQFVFGTDPLAEVRGASALLDRMNRHETPVILAESLGAAGGRLLTTVFANGGSGQFVAESDGPDSLLDALATLARAYAVATGGEVRTDFGFATLDQEGTYPTAARSAYDQLRGRREMGGGRRTVAMLPVTKECVSASHLSAQGMYRWGSETFLLADASRRKRQEIHGGSGRDRWAEWMGSLAGEGDWPDPADWGLLRSESVVEIGRSSSREGYIGLIYADGNRMGRIVRELDRAATCAEFSEIVDSSIRDACYQSLSVACAVEVRRNRQARRSGAAPTPLPADILLLGGDDLVVVLPADRALSFAEDVARRFEALTRARVAAIASDSTRRFFTSRVADRGLTISSGVALARAGYPFSLLLDLAEQLLASAKRGGAEGQAGSSYWVPAFVDFHLVAGSSGHDLDLIRERDYLLKTGVPRTQRPLALDTLAKMRTQSARLRGGRFPRSKLHDLFEASLEPVKIRAERRVREIFSRCNPGQREVLWEVVERMDRGGEVDFPWSRADGGWETAIADLVEAVDLFPEEITP